MEKDYPFLLLGLPEWELLLEKGSIPLPSRHEQHFLKVLKKNSFSANAGNGSGGILNVEVDRKAVRSMGSPESLSRNKLKTGLINSMVKRPALELIVQKATELGIDFLHFVKTERSVAENENVERYLRIAESAAMQSRNPWLPEIQLFNSLLEYPFAKSGARYFWGDWNAEEKIDDLKPETGNEILAFINGPEGGWGDEEKIFLAKSFHPVQLSKNVLRTETAAIVATYHLRSLADSFPG